MNKVILIGRLTRDPELRFTPGNGTAVASVTLAVDKYNASNGKKEADFIQVIIWGKQAEATANYMTKGSLMAISGRLQTRSHDAKDGTKRYVTEVVASETEFLSSREQQGAQRNNYQNQVFEDYMTPVSDGDIQF